MKKQNLLSKKCQQLGNAGDLSARPGSLPWAIAVKLELQSANVPFFFKQWGTAKPKNQILENKLWNEMPAVWEKNDTTTTF
ncbi:MAG: hypothetical protein F6K35_08810 [Okeania sp. SIO2H7]|nr:hypothetical protein [Okeania sp. SIO2H7]